uniref:Putative ovule protein n=1 Tax=Solanum chacoense TaxID=4108 RepID=A0A0V0HQC6_SOLCH
MHLWWESELPVLWTLGLTQPQKLSQEVRIAQATLKRSPIPLKGQIVGPPSSVGHLDRPWV